ncbi:MAG: ATP-dependent Lon protease, partial [Gaiellales bacterium]|nr:ATP-dependent Lon protease [Gaiellales bacterium]
METFLLIPLEDAVVFPNMTITLPIDVGDEERVLLVPTHENEYAKVGVVAEVTERAKLPGGVIAASLTGLHRAVLGAAEADSQGRLRVQAEPHADESLAPVKTRQLEQEYRAVVEEKLELRGDDGRVTSFLRSITDAGALADSAGYSPDLSFEQKLQLLQELDVVERLTLAIAFQRDALAQVQVRKRIRDDVETGAQKQQREYFLRKQMDSIRKELGEDDASVVDEYRTKIADAGMPESVRE